MDIAIGSAAASKIILPAMMALAACISKSKTDEQAQKLLKEHMVNLVEQSLINGQTTQAITHAQNISQAIIISQNQLLSEKDIYERLLSLRASDSRMFGQSAPNIINVSYEFGKSKLESESATNYAYTGSYCLDVMRQATERPMVQNRSDAISLPGGPFRSNSRFINMSLDAEVYRHQCYLHDLNRKSTEKLYNGVVASAIVLKNAVSYCSSIFKQIAKEESQNKEIENLCQNNYIFKQAYSKAINKAVDLVFQATSNNNNTLAARLELNKISIPGRAGKIISNTVRYLNSMYFDKNGNISFDIAIDLGKVEDLIITLLKSVSNSKEEYIDYLKRARELGNKFIGRRFIKEEQNSKFYQYTESKLSKFFEKLVPEVSQFWQIDQSAVNDNKHNCSYINVIEYCDNKEFNKAKAIIDNYVKQDQPIYTKLIQYYYDKAISKTESKTNFDRSKIKKSNTDSNVNISKCEPEIKPGTSEDKIPKDPFLISPPEIFIPLGPVEEIKIPSYGCGNGIGSRERSSSYCGGIVNPGESEFIPRPCNVSIQNLPSFSDVEAAAEQAFNDKDKEVSTEIAEDQETCNEEKERLKADPDSADNGSNTDGSQLAEDEAKEIHSEISGKEEYPRNSKRTRKANYRLWRG